MFLSETIEMLKNYQRFRFLNPENVKWSILNKIYLKNDNNIHFQAMLIVIITNVLTDQFFLLYYYFAKTSYKIRSLQIYMQDKRKND